MIITSGWILIFSLLFTLFWTNRLFLLEIDFLVGIFCYQLRFWPRSSKQMICHFVFWEPSGVLYASSALSEPSGLPAYLTGVIYVNCITVKGVTLVQVILVNADSLIIFGRGKMKDESSKLQFIRIRILM